MINNFKGTILFFTLLFIFCVSNVRSHPAWGIVVDSRKQIYFTDLETVFKIDAQGKLSIFRAIGGGRHVHDLSIDSQDNIYGIDNSYNQQKQTYPRSIWKISPQGEYSVIVPMTDNLPIGMSIWRDFDGNTYSIEPYNNEKNESKIVKRTPDGKTSVFAGGKYGYLDAQKNKARFEGITDIAFGRDGAIFLSGGDKIRKIDKSGIVTTVYQDKEPNKNQKNPETSTQFFGLDVDEQNNVFAADFANHRLLKISFEGKTSIVFRSEKDWTPLGVAVNGDEIFVLEGRPFTSATQTGNRVLKISADGKSKIVVNLEDALKTGDSPNANDNSLSLTDNATANENSASIKTPMILTSIIGVVCVAFVTFIIIVMKK